MLYIGRMQFRYAREAFRLPLVITAAALASCIYMVQVRATTPPQRIDSILILKKDHVMQLLSDGKVIHSYKVALGRGGLAPKEREGDGRVPEGRYLIDSRNEHSAYYKSLHISYPNADDRKRAAKLGVSTGGNVMIHGLPNGKGWIGAAHHMYDWTKGCIAVTDPVIDEIWKLVPVGTTVEIRP